MSWRQWMGLSAVAVASAVGGCLWMGQPLMASVILGMVVGFVLCLVVLPVLAGVMEDADVARPR